jgi:hypothetical protein
VDGSNFFNRTWDEFKAGFGDPSGNYWLGNEQLHQLTTNNQYGLRFDLQSNKTGVWYVAEYSTVTVASEADNYRLNVTGFSGNVSDDALNFGVFHIQNGVQFSTKDRDNDLYRSANCALLSKGGFWYTSCGYCQVNSMRGEFNWYWLSRRSAHWKLRTSRMWLVCG